MASLKGGQKLEFLWARKGLIIVAFNSNRTSESKKSKIIALKSAGLVQRSWPNHLVLVFENHMKLQWFKNTQHD